MRLQRGDLPILWTGGAGYHPDFVAVDSDGTRWVIEVKSDRDLGSDEVQDKRKAARRWANYVNKDPQVGERWAYLLASESDVKTAKGSWAALKKLGG